MSISQRYTKSRQNITRQKQTKNNRCCVEQQNESLVEDKLHAKLFKLKRMLRCHVLLLSACFFGFSSKFPTQQNTDASTTYSNGQFAAYLPYQTLISCSARFAFNHPFRQHERVNGSFYKRNAFPTVFADVHSEPSDCT